MSMGQTGVWGGRELVAVLGTSPLPAFWGRAGAWAAGGWELVAAACCGVDELMSAPRYRPCRVTVPRSRQLLVANALASLGGHKENFIFCNALNVSVCPLTEAAGRVSTSLGGWRGGSVGSRRG